MVQGLLFKKTGMKQVFTAAGQLVPVTVLKAPVNAVAQIKTLEKDGYQAVQLAVGNKKKLTRPLKGHLEKAGIKTVPKVLVEVGVEKIEKIKLGRQVKVEEIFEEGELVRVTGKSKGRGFAGVVKRWGFATQPRTHGQSDRVRAPGSIGAQTPGRVIKGKKMPGHYGAQRVTVKNLTVVKVDAREQEIWVKGAVPGPNKSFVLAVKTGKKDKKFTQLEQDEQKKSTKS